MGRVAVGSGRAKELRVRNDSESSGVGRTERLEKKMVERMKRGSWVTAGTIIVGRGAQECSRKSSSLRFKIYTGNMVS